MLGCRPFSSGIRVGTQWSMSIRSRDSFLCKTLPRFLTAASFPDPCVRSSRGGTGFPVISPYTALRIS